MVRAIFIEDRLLMLEALRTTIDWQERGIEPLAFFPSCDEALPFIEKEQPDVVVADIVMHGMDGLELSEYLHRSDLDVKVIIVSAHNRFDYAQRALQAGVFDYFEKPLDFDALADSILRAGQANAQLRQMRSFILNHQSFYRERFLTKLMLGQLEDAVFIHHEASFLQLDPHASMLCAAFQLRSADGGKNTMNRELTHLLLGSALGDTFGEEAVLGPFSLHNDEAVFLLCGSTAEEREIVSTLTSLCEQFAASQRMVVQAGVGRRVDDLTQLAAAYHAATRALDACFAFEDNCVMHVDDLPEESAGNWTVLNAFENQLIRAISTHDSVAMEMAVQRFRQSAAQMYLKSDALRVMMKSILFKVDSLFAACASAQRTVQDQIDRASSLDVMLDGIARYCGDVLSAVRINHTRQSRQVSEQAKAYIDTHFTYDTMSVNTVAAHVNMSPNYLCSVFKREYGQGMHEYMTMLRIERAKELLIHSTKSVGAIGVEVGYPNPYHFSMNFKKYTDLSPTEYRKKNQ